MKKNVIRLTESDLHGIIKESVKRILNEHEWWREEDWNENYPDDDYDEDPFKDPLTRHKEKKERDEPNTDAATREKLLKNFINRK